ncbi:response regulator transcription factor [Acrocarpospora macrocephala]|uniref:DNA-binding response regulator n=1 Tax=Acrocarpospora macrocephala TaxID=150177 RepID=A0A5M3X7B7_9ACTN|nr:response regulator transcription factor [Acrocarpospora macrocephala]GES15441.1 DNA-binding response regulator [Acrocarpospora macrocephala]
MEPINILLVDDHPAFRAGLVALLSPLDGIKVVDQVANGEQALALINQLQPDVVLMDLTMPGMGGVVATERILRDNPHIRVLILSMSDDDESVFAALRAGARGYVVKGARRVELSRAIRAVAAGDAVFGPAIANRLIGYFSGLARREQSLPQLTPREREILGLMTSHLTNPQIAERLALTHKTVRNHVSNIFAKLHVGDRVSAVSRARESGF